ncbi:DUF4261 domain-containing protein [Paenibacillus sp. YPG26]|uniref:DUF4261 domain-containing protein n=1 Tax=Paenibacillus sp. YPG26 TaxID=2878915 RepID=UPI00203A98C2|nr:DUF4261 domain-containing protein [Paenibacillus sp. YPG26]USB33954.1 DUF4261 domain-containing protein [Paenibacillus sp. YPG26]
MGLFDKLRGRQGESSAPSAEEKSGPIVGFVLLDRQQYDFDAFSRNLQEQWGIQTGEQTERESLVFEVDGMKVACGYMPAVIPNREVEENCKYNFLWREAEQVVSTHQAHIIVSVLGAEDAVEGHKLFTKVASSLLQTEPAIAIYTTPLVMEAGQYVDLAQSLKEDTLPVVLWVFIGMYQNDHGVGSYTVGLRSFGKDEVEIVNSSQGAGDVFEFVSVIVSFIIENDVTLRDGETIGFSAEQKLSLTRSPGVAAEGDSIKIAF